MGGKRNRNKNKKTQEKGEEIKTEEKDVPGSEEQKNDISSDPVLENTESLDKAQDRVEDAKDTQPSVEETKETPPEIIENIIEPSNKHSEHKEDTKANEEIKLEKVESVDNSEDSKEKSSRLYDSEAFASSESTPVTVEFKETVPDLSTTQKENSDVSNSHEKTEVLDSVPEKTEVKEEVKQEKEELIEEKEELIESKCTENKPNTEDPEESKAKELTSADPSSSLRNLSYDDSRILDHTTDLPEPRFSDFSDSKPPLPDLSNKPSSHSFLSHSSIDNSIADTLSIDTPNPESSPSKRTIYTSLVPEIEPYYKKVHSDRDSLKPHECEFTIHYETQFGQKIILVGESEELGEWDVFKGIPLNWNPGHFWSAKVQVSRVPVEYKYVCLSNETSVWEKGVNHKYTGELQTIHDSWQAI